MQSFLESSPSLWQSILVETLYSRYTRIYTKESVLGDTLSISLSLRLILKDPSSWLTLGIFFFILPFSFLVSSRHFHIFELPIPLCVRFIHRPTFPPFSPISISFVGNFRGLGISEFFHRSAPRVRNEHETTGSECNRRKTAAVLAKRPSTPVTTILQLWMIYSRIVCKHFRVTPPDLDKPPDACPFSFNLWTFRVYIEDFAKKAYAKPRPQYHFCLATI